MKKLSETYKELGIAFVFPIEIIDAHGNRPYYEDSDGFCCRWEYDSRGKVTYNEDNEDNWYKCGYDSRGNMTYFEDSGDYWCRWEHDSRGNVTYYENSEGVKKGTPRSSKTCEGKVIEVDGIKYKLTAQ